MSGFDPRIQAVQRHDYLTLSFVYSEGNTLETFANHNALRDTNANRTSSGIANCYISPEMHATFEQADGFLSGIKFFAIDAEKEASFRTSRVASHTQKFILKGIVLGTGRTFRISTALLALPFGNGNDFATHRPRGFSVTEETVNGKGELTSSRDGHAIQLARRPLHRHRHAATPLLRCAHPR